MRERYSLAYETRSLIYRIQAEKMLKEGRQITYGEAIEEAAERVRDFLNKASIRWDKVKDAEIPEIETGIEDSAAQRYRTYLNIDSDCALWLEELSGKIKEDFPGIVKSIYTPFTIRMVLRADYLISTGRESEILTGCPE